MANKTGINLYYDYLDNEFAELTLEEVGALTLAILATDDNREIREDAQQLICKERFLRTLLATMNGKTSRATNKWHEINGRFEESRAIKKIMERLGCSEEGAKKIYFGNDESNKDKKAVTTAQETPQSETEEDFTDEFLQYDLHTPVDDVFPIPDVVYLEIWKESKQENLPNEEDWESLLEEYDDDFLKAFVTRGNKDRWKKHYSEYLEN